MKTLSTVLLLIVLTSCERRSVPAATSFEKPEIEWHDAHYSIEDYKRMQPHRPILAIFTHKWDYPIAQVLKKKKFMDILKKNTFLCLNYESTAPESIGQVEMKKLGHENFPLAFVSIPNLGDSLHTFEYSEDELLVFVNKISKEAESSPRE